MYDIVGALFCQFRVLACCYFSIYSPSTLSIASATPIPLSSHNNKVDLNDPNSTSSYLDPPGDDESQFVFQPDSDSIDQKRFEVEWVKTVLENDDKYIDSARNLVKAATIAFERL